MSFRKFGTSDDQRVLSDEKDTQGVRKEAAKEWTEEDREELQWENEGGFRATEKRLEDLYDINLKDHRK